MVGVFQRLTGHMKNFTYLVADPVKGVAAVIDPSFGAQELEGIASSNGWRITHILNTHHHYDHIEDNQRLRDSTGAQLVGHEASSEELDLRVKDGQVLELGGLRIKAIHTPGHSPDSTCYLVDGSLFTGDTLFVEECGRCDLQGSDPAAMWHSLFHRLLELDDAVVVYPGHDYGSVPHSTIGQERANNYTLQPRTEQEFVRFVLSP